MKYPICNFCNKERKIVFVSNSGKNYCENCYKKRKQAEKELVIARLQTLPDNIGISIG